VRDVRNVLKYLYLEKNTNGGLKKEGEKCNDKTGAPPDQERSKHQGRETFRREISTPPLRAWGRWDKRGFRKKRSHHLLYGEQNSGLLCLGWEKDAKFKEIVVPEPIWKEKGGKKG